MGSILAVQDLEIDRGFYYISGSSKSDLHNLASYITPLVFIGGRIRIRVHELSVDCVAH